MNRRIRDAAAAAALLFLSANAADVAADDAAHPAIERGFKPELVYDFNGFDTVNLSNGNLMASISLGQSYPVSEGLSYGFALRYTGNLWNENRRPAEIGNPGGPSKIYYSLRSGDNAGTGWRISFGELYQGVTVDPNELTTAAARWRYVTPDGGEHLFWDTLHEPRCTATGQTNCDTYTAGVAYTRDNSYLRLKDVGGSQVIEFPDGQRHRYVATGTGYRLESIYTVSSTLGSDGSPTTNFVKFAVVVSAAGQTDWKVTDSHGREHWIRNAIGPVSEVELEAFGSTTATYSFAYETTSNLMQPCLNSEDDTRLVEADFLMSVTLPLGQTWSFEYNRPTAGACINAGDRALRDRSATVTYATLPTRGKIGWLYVPITTEDAPTAIAVTRRSMYDAAGSEIARKLYDVGAEATKVSVDTQVRTTSGNWATDSRTAEYRIRTWGRRSAYRSRRRPPAWGSRIPIRSAAGIFRRRRSIAMRRRGRVPVRPTAQRTSSTRWIRRCATAPLPIPVRRSGTAGSSLETLPT